MLELGADPNAIYSKKSIIHWAARHRNTEFLMALLEHGGDPDLMAGQPAATPIFETVGVEGEENLPAFKILVDSGANLDAKTGTYEQFGSRMGGDTPIIFASDVSRFDIVYMLLINGADYRLKNVNGHGLQDRLESVKGRYVVGSKQFKAIENIVHFIGKGESASTE